MWQLGMSSAADVTQEQFLLLLFQQGEGGGVVPLQVLAVLGLMLLCQGGTPGPGPHRWVVTPVALGALVVEFLGVLAVQEVSLPWEAEGSRGSAHQLRLSLHLSPGTSPPQIPMDEVLDSSLFVTGVNWLFVRAQTQELLLGGEIVLLEVTGRVQPRQRDCDCLCQFLFLFQNWGKTCTIW